MAALSRPLLAILAAAVVSMVLWLVALRPEPVAVRHTPLAPTQAIPQAGQAAAISDEANARREAAAAALDAP